MSLLQCYFFLDTAEFLTACSVPTCVLKLSVRVLK